LFSASKVTYDDALSNFDIVFYCNLRHYTWARELMPTYPSKAAGADVTTAAKAAAQQRNAALAAAGREADPLCQRLYVVRGKTRVAAFWQIRRDGASNRARILMS